MVHTAEKKLTNDIYVSHFTQHLRVSRSSHSKRIKHPKQESSKGYKSLEVLKSSKYAKRQVMHVNFKEVCNYRESVLKEKSHPIHDSSFGISEMPSPFDFGRDSLTPAELTIRSNIFLNF